MKVLILLLVLLGKPKRGEAMFWGALAKVGFGIVQSFLPGGGGGGGGAQDGVYQGEDVQVITVATQTPRPTTSIPTPPDLKMGYMKEVNCKDGADVKNIKLPMRIMCLDQLMIPKYCAAGKTLLQICDDPNHQCTPCKRWVIGTGVSVECTGSRAFNCHEQAMLAACEARGFCNCTTNFNDQCYLPYTAKMQSAIGIGVAIFLVALLGGAGGVYYKYYYNKSSKAPPFYQEGAQAHNEEGIAHSPVHHHGGQPLVHGHS